MADFELGGDASLWREEIFGPVLAVRSFASEKEAIDLANDSDYGLVATVVTRDEARASCPALRRSGQARRGVRPADAGLRLVRRGASTCWSVISCFEAESWPPDLFFKLRQRRRSDNLLISNGFRSRAPNGPSQQPQRMAAFGEAFWRRPDQAG